MRAFNVIRRNIRILDVGDFVISGGEENYGEKLTGQVLKLSLADSVVGEFDWGDL